MENEIQPNTPPIQPLPQSSTPIPTQKTTKWSKILLFTVLGLGAIAGSIFFGIQIGKNQTPNQQPIVVQPTASPTQAIVNPTALPTENPTIDTTTNWKTYTSTTYGLSFKYPQDYKVEERSDGFFVISTQTDNVPQSGISIDARQQGSYQSLAKAQANINTAFTVNGSSEVNGWTTFDVIGKEGMLKDIEFKLAIAPYKTGAIEMETINNEPYRNIFDQILSTFKFTN
ncbi:hypothetical protein KJ664_00570 [Patescibacteria group bacterium]|nr:hypothetical protein [Patescibacteria group bacterium]